MQRGGQTFHLPLARPREAGGGVAEREEKVQLLPVHLQSKAVAVQDLVHNQPVWKHVQCPAEHARIHLKALHSERAAQSRLFLEVSFFQLLLPLHSARQWEGGRDQPCFCSSAKVRQQAR